MAKNNYPQGQLDDIDPSAVQEIVTSLKQLHDKGKPQTDEEIKQRIDDYFSFCQCSSIRPGIESLCLALSIGRTCFFNWNNGVGCSPQCQEYVQAAKAFVAAFIEQSMLCGKLNPASSIFLLKNWCSYKDTISIEENMPNVNRNGKAVTAAEFTRQISQLSEASAALSAQDLAVLDYGENETM